jgi:ApaG protein
MARSCFICNPGGHRAWSASRFLLANDPFPFLKAGLNPSVPPRYHLFSSRRNVDNKPEASGHNHAQYRRMYRILQRHCIELQTQVSSSPSVTSTLLLHPPIDPRHAGRYRWLDFDDTSLGSKSRDTDPSVPALLVLRLFTQWLRDESPRGGKEPQHSVLLRKWSSVIEKKLNLQDDTPQAFDETLPSRSTLWTSVPDIRSAIRLAFRHGVADDNLRDEALKVRWNMECSIAAYRYLAQQMIVLAHTSVYEDHGVRIIATSRCVGRVVTPHSIVLAGRTSTTLGDGRSLAPGNTRSVTEDQKYRFAYRIRIENRTAAVSTSPSGAPTGLCVQLLGRTWIIEETPSQSEDDIIRVHAPRTGVVGQLPVLYPGKCFEYYSGCDLPTPLGSMKGALHFCTVPFGTPSSRVAGEATLATADDSDNEVDVKDSDSRKLPHEYRYFEVPVAPFCLDANADFE